MTPWINIDRQRPPPTPASLIIIVSTTATMDGVGLGQCRCQAKGRARSPWRLQITIASARGPEPKSRCASHPATQAPAWALLSHRCIAFGSPAQPPVESFSRQGQSLRPLVPRCTTHRVRLWIRYAPQSCHGLRAHVCVCMYVCQSPGVIIHNRHEPPRRAKRCVLFAHLLLLRT